MVQVFRSLTLAVFTLSPAALLVAQDPPAHSEITAQTVQLDAGVAPFVLAQVLDASTGSPVTGAQVFFSGTVVGGSTDSGGSIVLMAPKSGQFTLGVRSIGFCPAQLDLDIAPGTATQVLVALKPDPVDPDSVRLAPPVFPNDMRPVTPRSRCDAAG